MLTIDLKHDARVLAASSRAAELLAGADSHWAEVRERAMASVVRWEHVVGRGYSPLHPVWPEVLGDVRGKLNATESDADDSYGFDRDGQVVLWREHVGPGNEVSYIEYENGVATSWRYEEVLEKSWKRPHSVTVCPQCRAAEYFYVFRGQQYETRWAFQRHGQSRIDAWMASKRIGMPHGADFGAVEHYEARLDRFGKPVVVLRDGEVTFKKARGSFVKQLERLRKVLAREIPKQVAKEHAGHELYAVCLSYGEGEELMPPAVIGCRTEDFERLNAAPGRHWDAGPLWGLREPIHVDEIASVQKALEPVSYHLVEAENEKKAEAMLIELARELNASPWPKKVKLAPGFVVYPANAEGGDFQAQLQAVLDEPTEQILEEKGWWPPSG